MKTKRVPKESDQEDSRRVMNLLADLIKLNAPLEGAIWLAAFNAITADSMKKSGFAYEDYCEDLDRVKIAYKDLWDEDGVD